MSVQAGISSVTGEQGRAPSLARTRGTSLLSPAADFLLTGGGSLLVYAAMLLLVPTDEVAMGRIAIASIVLLFLVNYPHFAHSYQLLYQGFARKLTDRTSSVSLRLRYAWVGIGVPLIIAGYFAVCIALQSPRWLGYSLNAMFLLAAWHFARQGYGVLVVLSALKGAFLSRREQIVLKLNVHACWLLTWVSVNQTIHESSRYGLQYVTFALPPALLATFLVLGLSTTLATLIVLFRRWFGGAVALSLNGLLAYVATLYFWLLVGDQHPGFLALVPMFHALQYLPFVWKFKLNESRAAAVGRKDAEGVVLFRMIRFVVIGALLGFLLFAGLPRSIDLAGPFAGGLFGETLTLAFCATFVNVHHYFIDSVIWRADVPGVREYIR